MKKIRKKKGFVPPCYMGLDLSNTCSGITIIDSSGNHIKSFALAITDARLKKNSDFANCFNDPKRRLHMKKYSWIKDRIEELVIRYKVEFAVFEGYAYGVRSRAVTRLAELGGIIRDMICQCNIKDVLEITPGQNKKFLTGKGNAHKDKILQQVLKRWDKEFETSDEADSFGLALICYRYYGKNIDEKNFCEVEIDVINTLKKDNQKKEK